MPLNTTVDIRDPWLRPDRVRTHSDLFVIKVSRGGLNYDEVVVYDEDAALPSNLIVYSYY